MTQIEVGSDYLSFLDKWTIRRIESMMHPVEATSWRLVSKRYRRLLAPPTKMTADQLLLDGASTVNDAVMDIATANGATDVQGKIRTLMRYGGRWDLAEKILDSMDINEQSQGLESAALGAGEGGWLFMVDVLNKKHVQVDSRFGIGGPNRAVPNRLLPMMVRGAASTGQKELIKALKERRLMDYWCYSALLGESLIAGNLEMIREVDNTHIQPATWDIQVRAGMSGKLDVCNYARLTFGNDDYETWKTLLTGAAYGAHADLCDAIAKEMQLVRFGEESTSYVTEALLDRHSFGIEELFLTMKHKVAIGYVLAMHVVRQYDPYLLELLWHLRNQWPYTPASTEAAKSMVSYIIRATGFGNSEGGSEKMLYKAQELGIFHPVDGTLAISNTVPGMRVLHILMTDWTIQSHLKVSDPNGEIRETLDEHDLL